MPRETLPRQSPAQHRVQKGYVPIRRIAQACINCRRKKARCTGERPECSNCKRRDQECFYTAPRGHSLDEGIGSRPNEASSEQIGARLADIGDRITGIEDKLELLLDQHVDLSPSIEAPCSPEARYPSVDMGVDHTVWPFMPPKAEDTLQLPLSLDRQCILVDLYFTYCHNQPYSLFHENNFRERFNTGTLPHAVLLAVLANSSRFANHLKTTEASRQEAGGLADLAWHAIKGPCFSGTNTIDISILQALVLLCIFDFTEGSTRHSVAWVKVGIAVRLAQDLNFTDEPSPNLPVAEREEYRRAFWSLYLLERLVSCGKCRQPAILDRSCSPRLPCDEIAWLSGSEQQVATLVDFTSSSAVQNDDTNSFASVVVVASSLSHCAQYMLNTHHLGREHMPWHPQSGHAAIASEVLSLETRLAIDTPIENALKEQCSPDGFLDQSSSSTLVFSRLLFHLCQCLLYHPFLLSELVVMYNSQPPKAFWNHAKEISFHASRDMVDLLVRAKRAGCVLVSSFSGYCVTVAATVQGIHFTTSRSSEEHRFIEEHEQCVEHLEWLSRYWSNATSMESGLRDLRTMVFKYRSTDVQTSIHSRLEAQDRKLLWSLLDYSTLSKNIPDITRLRRVWNHNSPSMNEFLAL